MVVACLVELALALGIRHYRGQPGILRPAMQGSVTAGLESCTWYIPGGRFDALRPARLGAGWSRRERHVTWSPGRALSRSYSPVGMYYSTVQYCTRTVALSSHTGLRKRRLRSQIWRSVRRPR